MSRVNEILVELWGWVEDSKDPNISDTELLRIKNGFVQFSTGLIGKKRPKAAREMAWRASVIEDILIQRKVPGATVEARRISQASLLVEAGKPDEALEIFQNLLDKDPDSKELRKLIKWAKSKGG